jgi:hypothetical protein
MKDNDNVHFNFFLHMDKYVMLNLKLPWTEQGSLLRKPLLLESEQAGSISGA